MINMSFLRRVRISLLLLCVAVLPSSCLGDYNFVFMRVEVQSGDIFLGDVFFAEIVFDNIGEHDMIVVRPYEFFSFDLVETESVRSSIHNPARTIVVSRSHDADVFTAGRVKLLPGEQASRVCMLRAVNRDLTKESFQELVAAVPNGPRGATVAIFEADIRRFRVPLTFAKEAGKNYRPKELNYMQRRELGFDFVGLVTDRYETYIAIHGHYDFDKWRNGVLVNDQFPLDAETWAPIRDELHPDSNLLRFLKSSDTYRSIAKSDQSDQQKLNALLQMIASMRPLERRWMRPRIQQSLQQALPAVYTHFKAAQSLDSVP